MDLQPRAPEHGARWHHPHAEVGLGRIAPLLATTKNGGITDRRLDAYEADRNPGQPLEDVLAGIRKRL